MIPVRASGWASGREEVMAINPTNPFEERHFPGLRTRFQTFGRTRRGSGPKFCLALGAGVCARTEETLRTASYGNDTVGVLEKRTLGGARSADARSATRCAR